MIKNILLHLFILFLSSALFAQSGPYLRVSGGYSVSASNDVFTLTTARQDSNFNFVSESNIYGTIGSGAHFRLHGGYVFPQNFGLDLELEYLYGAKKLAGDEVTANATNLTYAYTRQFRLAPSIFVQANPGRVQPYAGFGVLIPVTGYTATEAETTTSSNFTFIQRKVYGSFSLGFNAYAGCNIQYPNENFSLFFDIKYNALRIKANNAEMTQNYSTNLTSGETTDNLSSLTASSTEINFVDEITMSSNTFYSGLNFDQEKPLDVLATKTNFNALSFNIGVRILFVKRPTED